MAEQEPKPQIQDPERLESLGELVGGLLVEMGGRKDPFSARNTDYLNGVVAALEFALGVRSSIQLPDGEVHGVAQTGDREQAKV